MYEKVDDADDGRQIAVYTISSPGAFGSGELKREAVKHQNLLKCYGPWLTSKLCFQNEWILIKLCIQISTA